MGTGTGPVSLIILTWNGLEVTRRCIRSIQELTDHPCRELVVVDNGSTDGTLEYLREMPGIRLIENGSNLGFVAGNNAGIRATTGDVVLLNNDTEVLQPDWLTRLQQLALSRPEVGMVGCRMVNAGGRLVHAGTYMPTPSFWGQEYPGDQLDIGQYTRDREVEGVIAACVYIRREVIDRVGLLDEDYFSYYEDTDYCLKARQAGFRVMCCGSVTIRHLENASTDLNRMDFSATFRRSRKTFISKWKDHYASVYSHRLTWRSHLTGSSMFSRSSAGLLHSLDRAGVDLNLSFLEGAEKAELDDFKLNDLKNRPPDRDRPQVLYAPPWLVERTDGTASIGYTFTPFDRFDPEWVSAMNRMDEIWVPSGFQAEAARASGVRPPVVVVPHGIDPDYLHPGITGYPLEGRFTFLAPLEWGEASAAEVLLRAFTDEFDAGENAVLVMKPDLPGQPGVTPPGAPGAGGSGVAGGLGGAVEHEVEAMNLPRGRAPVVFLVDHQVPFYQQGCLLRSADCVVLARRTSAGEPWEARSAACGIPVITSGWPGVEAPVAAACLETGYRLVPSCAPGLSWAQPDYSGTRKMMRKAYQEGAALKDAAVAASGGVRELLSFDRVAGAVSERLSALV